MKHPLPYQIPVIEYLKAHPHAGLLLDKRCGKTFCTLQWVKAHKPRKVLVVAPMSAIPGWLDEIEEDGGMAWDLTNSKNFGNWLENEGEVPGQFFLINPQGLFKAGRGNDPSPRETALWNWDAVIWDELTNIKSPKSQINKIAHACLGRIPLRCGLSGEYAPEGALDVFEPLRWIFGSFMGHANFYKWRNEYFLEAGYDWMPRQGCYGRLSGS